MSHDDVMGALSVSSYSGCCFFVQYTLSCVTDLIGDFISSGVNVEWRIPEGVVCNEVTHYDDDINNLEYKAKLKIIHIDSVTNAMNT